MQSMVRFFYPGPVGSDAEIDIFDPTKVTMPDGAFAFEFFDRTESNDVFKGVRYYPGGKVLTLEDVKREFPDNEILIHNMEVNGYDPIVQTKENTFQMFREGQDIVL